MTVNQVEVVDAIRRERANVEWISESLAMLRQKFGDKYIAVRNREVIDSDEDFEILLARVRKLEDPESVTIEHISAEEYVWML